MLYLHPDALTRQWLFVRPGDADTRAWPASGWTSHLWLTGVSPSHLWRRDGLTRNALRATAPRYHISTLLLSVLWADGWSPALQWQRSTVGTGLRLIKTCFTAACPSKKATLHPGRRALTGGALSEMGCSLDMLPHPEAALVLHRGVHAVCLACSAAPARDYVSPLCRIRHPRPLLVSRRARRSVDLSGTSLTLHSLSRLIALSFP